MDLNTINKRLENGYYSSAEECIIDIRMVFFNCYRYNSKDLYVYHMARTLEELFNSEMRNFPKELKIPIRGKNSGKGRNENSKVDCPKGVGQTPVLESKPAVAVSRKYSVPAVSRSQTAPTPRPKRKTVSASVPHSTDMPTVSSETSVSLTTSGPVPNNNKSHHSARKIVAPLLLKPINIELKKNKIEQMSTVQLNYCKEIINELSYEMQQLYACPFYNSIKSAIFDHNYYLHFVKTPMDLETVKVKLENQDYQNPADLASDVRLIFTNCYKYCDPDDEICDFAHGFQGLFEIRYANIPEPIFDDPVPCVVSSELSSRDSKDTKEGQTELHLHKANKRFGELDIPQENFQRNRKRKRNFKQVKNETRDNNNAKLTSYDIREVWLESTQLSDLKILIRNAAVTRLSDSRSSSSEACNSETDSKNLIANFGAGVTSHLNLSASSSSDTSDSEPVPSVAPSRFPVVASDKISLPPLTLATPTATPVKNNVFSLQPKQHNSENLIRNAVGVVTRLSDSSSSSEACDSETDSKNLIANFGAGVTSHLNLSASSSSDTSDSEPAPSGAPSRLSVVASNKISPPPLTLATTTATPVKNVFPLQPKQHSVPNCTVGNRAIVDIASMTSREKKMEEKRSSDPTSIKKPSESNLKNLKSCASFAPTAVDQSTSNTFKSNGQLKKYLTGKENKPSGSTVKNLKFCRLPMHCNAVQSDNHKAFPQFKKNDLGKKSGKL